MPNSEKQTNPFEEHAKAKDLIKKLKKEFFQFHARDEFDSKYFTQLNVDKLTKEKGHSKNNQQQIMKYVQRMHASVELRRDIIKFDKIL